MVDVKRAANISSHHHLKFLSCHHAWNNLIMLINFCGQPYGSKTFQSVTVLTQCQMVLKVHKDNKKWLLFDCFFLKLSQCFCCYWNCNPPYVGRLYLGLVPHFPASCITNGGHSPDVAILYPCVQWRMSPSNKIHRTKSQPRAIAALSFFDGRVTDKALSPCVRRR